MDEIEENAKVDLVDGARVCVHRTVHRCTAAQREGQVIGREDGIDAVRQCGHYHALLRALEKPVMGRKNPNAVEILEGPCRHATL